MVGKERVVDVGLAASRDASVVGADVPSVYVAVGDREGAMPDPLQHVARIHESHGCQAKAGVGGVCGELDVGRCGIDPHRFGDVRDPLQTGARACRVDGVKAVETQVLRRVCVFDDDGDGAGAGRAPGARSGRRARSPRRLTSAPKGVCTGRPYTRGSSSHRR